MNARGGLCLERVGVDVSQEVAILMRRAWDRLSEKAVIQHHLRRMHIFS